MRRARPSGARAALASALVGACLATVAAVVLAVDARAQYAASGAAPADAPPVSFRYRDGHKEDVAVRAWEEVPYVSAGDAARLVAARRSWRSESLRLTLRVGDREVRLSPGNPVAMIGERAVLLPGPVRVWEGRFWVPLDLVTEELVALSGGRAAWCAPRREFLVGRGAANIRSLFVGLGGGSTLIQVETTKLLPYDLILEGSRAIVLTLRGGVLPAEPLVARGEEAALVDSIEGEPVPGGAALRIALTRDLLGATAAASKVPVGVRLRLSLPSAPDTLAPPPLSALDGGGDDRPEEKGRAVAEPPPLPTVVIDPGHGGADEGALGASGVREKEVALAVALALRTRIEQRLGLRVVLTRETDEDLPVERRSEIANAAGGDLFLSLHCAAWGDGVAHGVAAYYLWTTTADDLAVTRRGADPSASPFADPRGAPVAEPRFLPWVEAQTAVVDESMRLAATLAAALARVLETPGRGAVEGPFRVLAGASMPAAVVELGFLTNAEDERLLASPAYRDRVADALFQGVERYFLEEGGPGVEVGMKGSGPREGR